MKLTNLILRIASLCWLCTWQSLGQETPSKHPERQKIPGTHLFQSSRLLVFRVTVTPEDLGRLRQDGRSYVHAAMSEGTNLFSEVGVHLKGARGSFRGVDDKPSWTIHFARFKPEQRLDGLRKIHLNNSVEDPGYINELVGSELCRAAGIPAPRVTQALVELNGRKLGLYVVKEGFTQEFLSLHFKSSHGNLYDTEPGHDVDEALHLDLGPRPEDRNDLTLLSRACQEPDLQQRWLQLQNVLDVDRFVSFAAVEVMLGHRDGYCLARNNFRIYHCPDNDRMVFIPHGMDQLFGKPDATPTPSMQGLVARALLETTEGRKLYRRRFASLLPVVLDPAALDKILAGFQIRVLPELPADERKSVQKHLELFKGRFAERRNFLELQLLQPQQRPLVFHQGTASIERWRPVDQPLTKEPKSVSQDGKGTLHLLAGPTASGSWRSNVLLKKGHYRFQGLVRTKEIKALDYGKNHGAGLRVSGVTAQPSHRLLGNHDWELLELDFETLAEMEVELICDLRASKGEAWFDLGSLRLKETAPE